MGEYAHRMPRHLSLGQRKRVSIATIPSMGPTLPALDESSSGLDPQAGRDPIDLLQRLPHTILMASHDLDLVRQVCTRAIVKTQGQLDADVPPDELAEPERLLHPQGLDKTNGRRPVRRRLRISPQRGPSGQVFDTAVQWV